MFNNVKVVNKLKPSIKFLTVLKLLILLLAVSGSLLYFRAILDEQSKIQSLQKVIQTKESLALAQGLYKSAFSGLPNNLYYKMLDSNNEIVFESTSQQSWSQVCSKVPLIERNLQWVLCSQPYSIHYVYFSWILFLLVVLISFNSIYRKIGYYFVCQIRRKLGLLNPTKNQSTQPSLTFEALQFELSDAICELQNLRQSEAVIRGQTLMLKQVAHDIASPLAALNFCIDGASFKSEDHRVVFSSSIQRLLEISKQALRMRSEKTQSLPDLDSDLTYLNISTVLRNIRQIAHEKALILNSAEDSINFSTSIKADLNPYLRISLTGFGRALSNVLDNAIEAVNCNLSKVSISVTIVDSGSEERAFVLVIEDSGNGISEEVLDSIKAGVGTTTKDSGNGIGLLGAIRFIENMGGLLSIERICGHSTTGTRVKIALPTIEEERLKSINPIMGRTSSLSLQQSESLSTIQ